MQVHRPLTNLLYPPACLLCHTRLLSDAQIVCETCQQAMRQSGFPICSRCGVSLPGAFDAVMCCAACRTRPLVFEMARAPWQYTGPAQQAIQQFKYHRRWRIGRWLAQAMASTATTALPLEAIGVVIPVPLHWLKRRLKGYNPSAQLAQMVSHTIEKPYRPGGLRRRRWTTTQTRLHGFQRFRNVQRAFQANPRFVKDQTVLLVDDVLTSGATANACALALKEAGACAVFVLTAARTPLA